MDKSLSNSKQKVETKQVDLDTGMPDLPKKELFAITFAFLGINMAFSLQSSQMSRICQTIGANPNNLGFFFIFPPLMDDCTTDYGKDVRSDMESLWSSVALPIIWDSNCGISFDHVTVLRFAWLRLWFNGCDDLCCDSGMFDGLI